MKSILTTATITTATMLVTMLVASENLTTTSAVQMWGNGIAIGTPTVSHQGHPMNPQEQKLYQMQRTLVKLRLGHPDYISGEILHRWVRRLTVLAESPFNDPVLQLQDFVTVFFQALVESIQKDNPYNLVQIEDYRDTQHVESCVAQNTRGIEKNISSLLRKKRGIERDIIFNKYHLCSGVPNNSINPKHIHQYIQAIVELRGTFRETADLIVEMSKMSRSKMGKNSSSTNASSKNPSSKTSSKKSFFKDLHNLAYSLSLPDFETEIAENYVGIEKDHNSRKLCDGHPHFFKKDSSGADKNQKEHSDMVALIQGLNLMMKVVVRERKMKVAMRNSAREDSCAARKTLLSSAPSDLAEILLGAKWNQIGPGGSRVGFESDHIRKYFWPTLKPEQTHVEPPLRGGRYFMNLPLTSKRKQGVPGNVSENELRIEAKKSGTWYSGPKRGTMPVLADAQSPDGVEMLDAFLRPLKREYEIGVYTAAKYEKGRNNGKVHASWYGIDATENQFENSIPLINDLLLDVLDEFGGNAIDGDIGPFNWDPTNIHSDVGTTDKIRFLFKIFSLARKIQFAHYLPNGNGRFTMLIRNAFLITHGFPPAILQDAMTFLYNPFGPDQETMKYIAKIQNIPNTSPDKPFSEYFKRRQILSEYFSLNDTRKLEPFYSEVLKNSEDKSPTTDRNSGIWVDYFGWHHTIDLGVSISAGSDNICRKFEDLKSASGVASSSASKFFNGTINDHDKPQPSQPGEVGVNPAKPTDTPAGREFQSVAHLKDSQDPNEQALYRRGRFNASAGTVTSTLHEVMKKALVKFQMFPIEMFTPQNVNLAWHLWGRNPGRNLGRNWIEIWVDRIMQAEINFNDLKSLTSNFINLVDGYFQQLAESMQNDNPYKLVRIPDYMADPRRIGHQLRELCDANALGLDNFFGNILGRRRRQNILKLTKRIEIDIE